MRASKMGFLPRFVTRWFRDERGNGGIEFAIAAPVLTLIVVGGIDYGSAFVEGQKLESAAQAGTQETLYDPLMQGDHAAIVHTTLESYAGQALTQTEAAALEVTATAQNFCACVNGAVVACTDTCSGEAPGEYVTVTIDGGVDTILSYPWLDADEIPLTRTSSVRVQ